VFDPSPQILEGLEPRTRSAAIQLLNAFRTAGVPLIASSGRRTIVEQTSLVFAGKSRTFSSKHLSGRAFDVDVAGWSRDSIPAAFWPILWGYAAQLGLSAPLKTWDKGHLESP
jgi:hypothetical protein